MHQNSGFKELYDALTARIETADTLKQSNSTLSQSISTQRSQSTYEYDIFLSFSSKEYNDAHILGEKLRAYGLKVFMSNDSLAKEAGKPFFDQIDHALKQSAHFLLYCSVNTLQSGWVKHEYQAFFHQFYIPSQGKRRFILYETPDFDRATLPALLSGIQTASELKTLVGVLVAENTTTQQVTPSKKDDETENKAWDNAKDTFDVKQFQAYIDEYPQGKFVKEAQKQISKLEKGETAWWQALETNTINAYTDFIAAFPGGKYTQQASLKLNDLQQETANAEKRHIAEEEEGDWQKALNANTFDGYQAYSNQYPSGKYTALANTKLAAIKKISGKQVNKAVASNTGHANVQLNKQFSTNRAQARQAPKKAQDLPEWMAYTLLIFFMGSFLLLAFSIASNTDTSEGFDGIYLLGPILG
jgi:TolA-binding protein